MQYSYDQVVSYDALEFTTYQTIGSRNLAVMWISIGAQQWGLDVPTPIGSYVKTISFPIPFAKNVYAINCTTQTVSDGETTMLSSAEVRLITTDSFKMQASHYNHEYPMIVGVFWMAIGN